VVAVSYSFAGIPVADFPAAYAWYVRLLGRAADMFPHDDEAVWRLTPGGAVYVVGDCERAGHGLLTLAIDDLDAYADRLRADGVALTEESEGGAPRRLVVTDDDGNRITFFQDRAL
jgi:catechol 2,3-dioxygenase-like lactoylglutathione lyase family enzyme